MHVLFQFFPFTVQLKCLLDKQFVNIVIKRTHLFRRLLVESPRLIFGVSSRGGLGQEGQRSNMKHKQAKYQFSEQTSSSLDWKNNSALHWRAEGVHENRYRNFFWIMANSPYPILAKSFTHTHTQS